MKFEHTKVFNFEGAFRGMRNAYDSWDKSDSDFSNEVFKIGEADMKLAQSLVIGGPPHRKFLRQILVSVDITAPLYWWKQFDTYKVGTVANSQSTMHTLAKRAVTIEDFAEPETAIGKTSLNLRIEELNVYLNVFRDMKEKKAPETKAVERDLFKLLPDGWMQKRTITMNYEVILSMCYWRRGHKLKEWHDFIAWAETLPYAKELLFKENK